MTQERDDAVAELLGELRRDAASGRTRGCRIFDGPIGPTREEVGWQAEAGEEDQSQPGWDNV